MSSTVTAENAAESTAPPRSLFRDRDFLLLWAAQAISSLGDWALMIAIPVTVYNATGSRTALSFAFVSETLPLLVLGILAGVVVDRWERRRLMIASDIGRMLATLLLLTIPSIAHLNQGGLWIIYGVAFATSALGSVFSPARQALMTDLLPREKLMQATALSSSSQRVTALLGPALAGVLLLWLHPRGVFIFDAATFAVSAVCVFLIRDPRKARKAVRGLEGFWTDLLEGLRLFAPGTMLGLLITLVGTAAFAGGIYNTLEYAYVHDVMKLGGSGFGFMMSALGLGALTAVPLVAGPLKEAAPGKLVSSGLAIMAVSLFVLVSSRHTLMGAVCFFGFGLGNMIMYLPIVTLFALAAEPAVRGRVYGTASSLGALFAASASLAAAGLVVVIPDLRVLFACLGVVFAVSAVVALRGLNRKADDVSGT